MQKSQLPKKYQRNCKWQFYFIQVHAYVLIEYLLDRSMLSFRYPRVDCLQFTDLDATVELRGDDCCEDDRLPGAEDGGGNPACQK